MLWGIISLSFFDIDNLHFFLFVNLARSLYQYYWSFQRSSFQFFHFLFFFLFWDFMDFFLFSSPYVCFALCFFFSDLKGSLYLWFEIFLSLSCTLLMLFILKALFQGHTKYLICYNHFTFIQNTCLVSLDIIHPMDYLEICWLISKCLEIFWYHFSLLGFLFNLL